MLQKLLKNLENLRQITEYRYCGLGTGAGWSEEPDGEIVMLENGGFESVTRQKRTRVLLLE